MIRIDKHLFDIGLVRSRALASELIEKGRVSYLGEKVKKSSFQVSAESAPEDFLIEEDDLLQYVSRGGVKLKGALDRLKLDVRGKAALDIGLSTGGFSDCLLQSGVKSVLGVDVGTEQLHESLRNHPQLKYFDNFHFEDLKIEQASSIEICVVDLSFVSITKALPVLGRVLPQNCQLLSLVKPQFELNKKSLNKKGIVRDQTLYDRVEESVIDSARENDFNVVDFFESSIQGGDGNREFFLFATKN